MTGRNWLLTALAVLALAVPATVEAQAAPSQESMAALAKLHVELNTVRDEFNNKLSKIHELHAKDEARVEFTEHVAEVFEKHHRTQEEYQQLLFSVSTDAEQRALFEQLVKEAMEAGPSA